MNNTYVSCTYDTNICYNEWLFQVLRSNDKMMFVVYFFSLSKHVCPMGYSEQLHLSPKVLLYLYLLKYILPYQYLINTYKVSKWHIYPYPNLCSRRSTFLYQFNERGIFWKCTRCFFISLEVKFILTVLTQILIFDLDILKRNISKLL